MMTRHAHFFSLVLVFSISIMLSPATPGSPGSILAACYVAPGGDDTQNCSDKLMPCETIDKALSELGCSTINVAIGTYLGTGDNPVVTINKSVEIDGGWDETFSSHPGMSIIDAEGSQRGIVVNSFVNVIVTQLTIANGFADGAAGISISNDSHLSLIDSIVKDNIDFGNASSEGGGIRVGENGALSLRYSTVRDNQSSSGAGVFNAGGLVEITNSTISGNSARGTGGGINNLGGEVYLNNTTISNNTDNTDSGEPDASGIHNDGEANGIVVMRNSIIAGNAGSDCDGMITSFGNNLIEGSPQCNITAMQGEDLINVDPGIGVLQDNGGLTATHALLFGSPAINAGNLDGCEDNHNLLLIDDQRKFSRVQRCDIGAFEFQTYLYQTQLPIVIKSEQ